jgi:rubrerythrin
MADEEIIKEERKPKRNDKYKCPRCGVQIVLHIQPSEPPTCHNTESHSQTVVVMEKV